MTAQISLTYKNLAALALALLILAIGAGLALPTAYGQETNSQIGSENVTLTAIPPRLGDEEEIRINPGENEQVQVRVRNSTNRSLEVISQANDFIIGEDGTTPMPVRADVSNRWSLASWLTTVPAQQTLAAGQTAGVNVLIEVPENALPGGHYAMITHEPADGDVNVDGDETTQNQQSASAVSQKVGTLLYVVVDGPINEEAFVRDFTFPQLTEFGPVPFSFTVENASDIHISPRTSIEIFNMLGRKVDTIDVEPQNVFPLMSRSFEGQWDQVWGTGLYTAKLTMSYGESGAVTMAQTRFWLVPVKLILAITIGLLTAVAIFISARRHWIHRQGHEKKRIEMLENKLQELEANNLDKYED